MVLIELFYSVDVSRGAAVGNMTCKTLWQLRSALPFELANFVHSVKVATASRSPKVRLQNAQ